MPSLSRRECLAGTAALALPLPALAAATDPTAAAMRLLDDTAEAMLAAYPERASELGIDDGKRRALRGRLYDTSPDGQVGMARLARDTLARLGTIDTQRLSPAVATHVDVARTAFQIAVDGYALPYGDVATLTSTWRNSPYAVAQNVGAYLDTPQTLTVSHRLDNAGDAEAYLARIAAFAAQLDGETARVRDAAGKGVILPDFALSKYLQAADVLRRQSAGEWDVVTTLAAKTKAKGLKGDYADRAARLIDSRVRSALDRQYAAHVAMIPKATADAGAWKLPEGDAYYAWALRAATTTAATPDEIHAQGLEELAALHARMDPLLRAEGYSQGSVGARMTALGKDPRYLFPEGDPGRAEIMAYLRAKLADMKARMPRAFETLVPGYVEVTRMAPAAEPGAPGAYGGAGSIDGKEPGRFWINLGTTSRWTKFALPDLAYHEALPGHVWQGEYSFKQPLIRTLLGFSAYTEGWALYAEQLADELGVYDDFPVGRLGYLQSLAFRACRMVVDTGIHAKRWTREQAVAFFVEQNGSNPEEVASEVDRYCTWPGQACAYKMGHTTINRLRDKAKAALGAGYDFRAFNDAVVLGGNVPLTVLERTIDTLVAARG